MTYNMINITAKCLLAAAGILLTIRLLSLKTAVKSVIIVFCVVTAAAVILNTADHVLFLDDPYIKETTRNFETRKNDVEVLFFGSSSMRDGIIPSAFTGTETFNFSPGAENTIQAFYRLRHYIDDMPKLRLLVIELPYTKFSDTWYDYKQYYSYISFKDALEIASYRGWSAIKEKLDSFNPYTVFGKDRMILFLKELKKYVFTGTTPKKMFFKSRVTIHDDGWREVRRTGPVKRNEVEKIKEHCKGNQLLDPVFLKYYLKILMLCEEKGITVVTLTCPVIDAYTGLMRGYLPKEVFYSEVVDNPVYAGYVKKHLDLEEIYGKEHASFWDSVHLNTVGAHRFTGLVKENISDIIKGTKK